MKCLLIDCGAKLPSLALMRLSNWHKMQGDRVEIMNFGDKIHDPAKFDKIFVSVIFTRDQPQVEKFRQVYGPKVQIGGPGWHTPGHLPPQIEACRPDWNLYTAELLYPRIKGPYSRETRLKKAQHIVDSGIGRLSIGCPRRCAHCLVPRIEGPLRNGSPLANIINPRSNTIHLLDNSFGEHPRAIELLQEAKSLGLILNISQGIDVRSATPEFLKALCQADLWGDTIYIAWDRMQDKEAVLAGIERLKPLAKAYKKSVTCFTLTKFDTNFTDDQLRIHTLHQMGIRPFVMPYNEADRTDPRMAKFKRFVNAFYFKRMDFETEYEPWLKVKAHQQNQLFA